jgi:hypothetical protein
VARSVGLYLLASLVAIGLAGAVFARIYGAANDRRAVWVSAGIALVVQAIAFVVAWRFARGGNGIAGWTLGAVICLVALVLYGFVCRAVGLPANAALLSLATFFFLTELIEPPLLNV